MRKVATSEDASFAPTWRCVQETTDRADQRRNDRTRFALNHPANITLQKKTYQGALAERSDPKRVADQRSERWL